MISGFSGAENLLKLVNLKNTNISSEPDQIAMWSTFPTFKQTECGILPEIKNPQSVSILFPNPPPYISLLRYF